MGEHFLSNESQMSFDRNKPKPSDRSVFRLNIGRALLTEITTSTYGYGR